MDKNLWFHGLYKNMFSFIKVEYVLFSNYLLIILKSRWSSWIVQQYFPILRADVTYTIIWPAPMAHSYRLGLVAWRYQIQIPVGPDICHRGCAYSVLQTVQRPGVYSAAYGTVHYKERLKSFEIGQSPGFGLPSVAILPWLCRKRRKAIFIFIYYNDFSRLTTDD